jgi:hypothetical protein
VRFGGGGLGANGVGCPDGCTLGFVETTRVTLLVKVED